MSPPAGTRRSGPDQRAWLVRPNVRGRNRLPTWLDEGYCAIGWYELGAVPAGTSREELAARIDAAYPTASRGARRAWVGNLDRFLNRIDVGDLVVTPEGPRIHVGEVLGPPYHVERHQEARMSSRPATRRWGPSARRGAPDPARPRVAVRRATAHDGGGTAVDASFMTVREGRGPVIATAIHAGHDLRPEVAEVIAIDDDQRRYEEDPFTARWVGLGDTTVVVHRSRFEVDLNRPRAGAVYPDPDAAWGLDGLGGPPGSSLVEGSRRLHDDFYAAFARLCERAASAFGAFVVYDLHTYNHRRAGPEVPAAGVAGNPDINVGTGSLDRDRWGEVVDRFIQVACQHEIDGRPLDVRENVRFTGGHLVDWVHTRFPDAGVGLALDVKKIHVDEHTGEPIEPVLTEVGRALASTVRPVVSVLRRIATR